MHLLAEVGLTGGLDAIGATTEVDRVEVVLQDLILGVLLGHLGRDDHFVELADQAVVVLAGDHLDVLLGDCGTTAGTPGQLVPGRSADAHDVEAGIGTEAAILGGQHRVLHVLRHVRQAHLDPVSLLGHITTEFGAPIAGHDRGYLLTLGGQRRRGRHIQQEITREEREERRKGREECTHQQDIAHFALGAGRRGGPGAGTGLSAGPGLGAVVSPAIVGVASGGRHRVGEQFRLRRGRPGLPARRSRSGGYPVRAGGHPARRQWYAVPTRPRRLLTGLSSLVAHALASQTDAQVVREGFVSRHPDGSLGRRPAASPPASHTPRPQDI